MERLDTSWLLQDAVVRTFVLLYLKAFILGIVHHVDFLLREAKGLEMALLTTQLIGGIERKKPTQNQTDIPGSERGLIIFLLYSMYTVRPPC